MEFIVLIYAINKIVENQADANFYIENGLKENAFKTSSFSAKKITLIIFLGRTFKLKFIKNMK